MWKTPPNHAFAYQPIIISASVKRLERKISIVIDGKKIAKRETERMGESWKATTDLCDRYEEDVRRGLIRVASPVFRSFGRKKAFEGRVETTKAAEDNVLVRKVLEEEGGGHGKVLVVDGGGSMRCALLGGNLAQIAEKNGWAGVVVDGCVRDVGEIAECDVGVMALASHPLRSKKLGHGERGVVVSIRGCTVSPNEWCYADADGIIFSPSPLSL